MKLSLSLRTVNLGLAVLLILVMGSQVGLKVPLGKGGLPITLGDVVLALAAVGVGIQLLNRRLRGLRLPPVQAFVLVAAACATLARSGGGAEAAKEVFQLVEYLLIAFAVFLNVAEGGDLKVLLAAFAAATACTVVWAGWQYLACDSALRVSAGFENRNALGAFLAISLPVLYGLALYARCWGIRIALLALVAAGLLVNLSGGAVLVTVLVLGLLSALRGQKALLAYLGAIGLVLLAGGRLLPRPHHTDILLSSVTPYVRDNFLLSDRALFARAAKLRDDAHAVMAESPGAALSPKLFDAHCLMEFLLKRRGGDWRRLTADQWTLCRKLRDEAGRAAELFPEAARASALAAGQQIAVRYQRWHAAIACCRDFWGSPSNALFGVGLVDYHDAVNAFRPTAKLQQYTDVAEAYNVATDEPFTHDTWLKALVQNGLLGLLALGWLVAAFLGRALRLYGAAHSELMLGLALGAAGGILGFALAGVFTETIARGLTIPFIFVCSLVVLGERIVHGDGGSRIEQPTPDDD